MQQKSKHSKLRTIIYVGIIFPIILTLFILALGTIKYEISISVSFVNTPNVSTATGLDGSIGNWKFNETSGTTAADSSGNGNTGTLINGPVWTTGKIGSALSFDGVDDYVDAGNGASLNVGYPLSVEAWFKPSTVTGTHQIVDKFAKYWIRQVGNKVNVMFKIAGTERTLASVSTIQANQWYHVVGTYDGSTINIYLNGNLNNSTSSWAGNLSATARPLTIGVYHYFWPSEGFNNRFSGAIDEVKIYNKVLSASEVLSNYQSAMQTQTPASVPFKRMAFVSKNGTNNFNTTLDIDTAINNLAYMNADAMLINIGTEYFESVRDPNGVYLDGSLKKDLDPRASWNMLEYVIQKAHAKNIKVYVWTPIMHQANMRAEDRLFGTQFRVMRRDTSVTPNTYYPDTDRNGNDIGFKTLADYEISNITFIAEHYPELDGVNIEEPQYPWDESYSQPIIDKYVQKYGYDPRTVAETATVISQIQGIMKEYMNDFFLRLRESVNANKTNANFMLTANGAHYYAPQTGFDPKFMSQNKLLDWYAAQIYRSTTTEYTSAVTSFNALVTEIPTVSIVAISFTKTCDSNNICTQIVNPAVIDQIKATCQYGSDAEGVYGYQYRDLLLNGITAFQRIHDTPISALCTGDSTISGPVAYWKFNEISGTTAADSSGNGNTGTLVNGPVWTAGKVGNALSFDGINDYVNIGNNSSLNPTGAITIEAWINPKVWPSYSARIVSKENVTEAAPYDFESSATSLQLSLDVGAGEKIAARSASLPPLNQWTHVAVVWNGSVGKIYFNGVQNGTDVSFTGTMPVITTSNVLIGNNPTNTRQFKGMMDDVKIYNRALTAAEIKLDAGL